MGGLSLNSLLKSALDVIDQRVNLVLAMAILLLIISVVLSAIHVALKFAFKWCMVLYSICLIFKFNLAQS